MPCTEKDLRQKFAECVNAFNAFDPTIGNNLAQTVTIRTITHHTTTVGKAAVIAFLAGQFADHPNFNPGQFRVAVDGTRGTVEGNGRWKDDDVVGPFQPINYKFEFECTNGSWLLSDGRSVP